MKNRAIATALIVLASVGILMVPLPTFAHFASYFAGGLGAGVGAGIVRARPPAPVWKDSVVCLSAAYVPCVVIMVFGFPLAYALGYALLPTVLYGSAAIIFATSADVSDILRNLECTARRACVRLSRPNDAVDFMQRFVAVLVLAFVGMVWFLFADFVQRCALITAFAAAALLPLLMNPTRHWAKGFFLCFDMVYAASCIGAWWGSMVHHVPRVEVFTAGLIPALLFGTMASLGVGRSGLAELEH